MAFYGSIAKVYDSIFPVKQAKVEFVKQYLKKTDTVLDIGCSSGAFLHISSDSFYQGVGIDLDETMIDSANALYQKPNVSYKVGDMTRLSLEFDHGSFDVITCFGNTLVHIDDPEVVLKGVYDLLTPKGTAIIQILNYDYIQRESITTLPLIDNDQVKFVRQYHFVSPHIVDFETILTIKESDHTIHNQITLYPVYEKELEEIIGDVGFDQVEFYKAYDGTKSDGNGLPLIMVLKKTNNYLK